MFRFYQAGEIGESEPQPELVDSTGDRQIANAKNDPPEASNSSNRTEACVQSEQHHVFKTNKSKSRKKERKS